MNSIASKTWNILGKAVGSAVLGIALLSPTPAHARVFLSVAIAPPVIPVYEQPLCPGEGYIWTPGYWAYGDDGYVWVDGSWVEAPYEGALWTPGYWGFNNGGYLWNAGYWGPEVGYYGGINYGFGYFGTGFYGGYWGGGRFFYNSAYNRLDFNRIHGVYRDPSHGGSPFHPGGRSFDPHPRENNERHSSFNGRGFQDHAVDGRGNGGFNNQNRQTGANGFSQPSPQGLHNNLRYPEGSAQSSQRQPDSARQPYVGGPGSLMMSNRYPAANPNQPQSQTVYGQQQPRNFTGAQDYNRPQAYNQPQSYVRPQPQSYARPQSPSYTQPQPQSYNRPQPQSFSAPAATHQPAAPAPQHFSAPSGGGFQGGGSHGGGGHR